MQRLAAKEAEVAELQSYAFDLYRMKQPAADFSMHHLTDPVIAVEFQLMKAHLMNCQRQLDERNEQIRALKDQLDAAEKKLASDDHADQKVSQEDDQVPSGVDVEKREDEGQEIAKGGEDQEDENKNAQKEGPKPENGSVITGKRLEAHFSPSSSGYRELRAAKRRIVELEAQVESLQEANFAALGTKMEDIEAS